MNLEIGLCKSIRLFKGNWQPGNRSYLKIYNFMFMRDGYTKNQPPMRIY